MGFEVKRAFHILKLTKVKILANIAPDPAQEDVRS